MIATIKFIWMKMRLGSCLKEILNLENQNYQFIGFKENYGNEYKSIILNDENFDNVNFYYKGNFSFNYEK